MSTDPHDAIRAWRNWRKAEAAYNQVARKLDDWTSEVGSEFHAAKKAKEEAWKRACYLLDAASLTEDDKKAAPEGAAL